MATQTWPGVAFIAGVIFMVCHTPGAAAAPTACAVPNCAQCEPHREFVCQVCVPGYETHGPSKCQEDWCSPLCQKCHLDPLGNPKCMLCFVGFKPRGKQCVKETKSKSISSVARESSCSPMCMKCHLDPLDNPQCMLCLVGFVPRGKQCVIEAMANSMESDVNPSNILEHFCSPRCLDCELDPKDNPKCTTCFVGFVPSGRECVIDARANTGGSHVIPSKAQDMFGSSEDCGEHCLSCRRAHMGVTCLKCLPGFLPVAHLCEADGPGNDESTDEEMRNAAPGWDQTLRNVLKGWI